MTFLQILPDMLVMASVTYLIRMLPLVFVKKKIDNPFFLSFMYYIPYSVLAAMTFPTIFYSTGNFWSAAAGTVTAVLTAFRGKSLLCVALSACAAAMVASLLFSFVTV